MTTHFRFFIAGHGPVHVTGSNAKTAFEAARRYVGDLSAVLTWDANAACLDWHGEWAPFSADAEGLPRLTHLPEGQLSNGRKVTP